MKKILFLAAATAIALSSCSKNEVEVNSINPTNAIGFGTYVGSATRATSETAFSVGDVFVIDAYYTAEKDMSASTPVAFMQNQIVTESTTDVWTYSPIKYWPNNTGDKVSFFAVTNATANSPLTDFDNLASGETTPSFTVTDASTDIMIASALNVTKPKATDTDPDVDFSFQHTMSQVNFTAQLNEALITTGQNTDDITKVSVTSLTVDYSNDGNATTYKGGTFTFSNTKNNEGKWALATSGDTRGEDKWETVNKNGIGSILDGTTVTNKTVIGEPIMIIPVSGASYKVTVLYTVATTDDDAPANKSTITNTCTFNIAPTAMNTIYTYNLKIGLKSVDVSGNIANWTNSTAVDKNVTIDSSTGSVEE